MKPRAATFSRPETAAAWVFCALAGAAYAQDVKWVGASGRWSEARNWNPARVPGLADRAVLGALPAGPYTATVDIAARVGGLQLIGTNPHTAPIGLTGAGGVTVSGPTLLDDALLTGLAGFVSAGTLVLAGDVCNDLVDTPLEHTGSIAQWTGGHIHLKGAARITNRSLFEILSARNMNGDATATFDNQGTLCKESPGTTTISGISFVSSGEVCVTQGVLTIVGFATSTSLEEGAWVVENAAGTSAALDLAGGAYDQIDGAQVTLGGTNSAFDAINGLETVGPGAGSLFKVRSGKVFRVGDLTVEQAGEVRVGETGTALSSLFVSGLLTNGGSVHIAPGAGTLVVNNQVVAPGGELSGSGVHVGSLGNNGTVAPGPDELDSAARTGVLTIENGVYRQGEQGRLIIDIEGRAAGEQYDVLQTLAADFGSGAGVLEIRMSGAFRPKVGERFQVMRWQERRGEFAQYVGLQGLGVTFRPLYEPQGLTLIVAAVECYADCDDSGRLDFFDFLCFQNAFGKRDPYADCDGGGAFDFFDFLCFQNQFAMGCP